MGVTLSTSMQITRRKAASNLFFYDSFIRGIAVEPESRDDEDGTGNESHKQGIHGQMNHRSGKEGRQGTAGHGNDGPGLCQMARKEYSQTEGDKDTATPESHGQIIPYE